MSKEVKDGIVNYYKKLSGKYPLISVNTNISYYPNEYFGDSSHMNDKGAREYCKYIFETYEEVFKNSTAPVDIYSVE